MSAFSGQDRVAGTPVSGRAPEGSEALPERNQELSLIPSARQGRADQTCPSKLAERVGFEPTDRSPGQRFSRPPHSTTLAPLRLVSFRSMAERVGFEPTVEFPLHTLS